MSVDVFVQHARKVFLGLWLWPAERTQQILSWCAQMYTHAQMMKMLLNSICKTRCQLRHTIGGKIRFHSRHLAHRPDQKVIQICSNVYVAHCSLEVHVDVAKENGLVWRFSLLFSLLDPFALLHKSWIIVCRKRSSHLVQATKSMSKVSLPQMSKANVGTFSCCLLSS